MWNDETVSSGLFLCLFWDRSVTRTYFLNLRAWIQTRIYAWVPRGRCTARGGWNFGGYTGSRLLCVPARAPQRKADVSVVCVYLFVLKTSRARSLAHTLSQTHTHTHTHTHRPSRAAAPHFSRLFLLLVSHTSHPATIARTRTRRAAIRRLHVGTNSYT